LRREMSEVSLLVTSRPTLSTRGLPVAYGLARATISRAVETPRQLGIAARIIAEVLPKQPALIEII
jgi:hypothetical protein